MQNTTPAEAAAIGGAIGAIVAFIVIFALILFVLMVIANWKIFKKAGEPGWKSIIPVYNVYIMFKIVNMKNWFWWLIAISLCGSIMCSIDGFNPNAMTEAEIKAFDFAAHPMTIAALVIMLIAEIWGAVTYACRTSKVFGHGLGYTIGLIFLPNIFWLILAFDKSKYNLKALKK